MPDAMGVYLGSFFSRLQTVASSVTSDRIVSLLQLLASQLKQFGSRVAGASFRTNTPVLATSTISARQSRSYSKRRRLSRNALIEQSSQTLSSFTWFRPSDRHCTAHTRGTDIGIGYQTPHNVPIRIRPPADKAHTLD